MNTKYLACLTLLLIAICGCSSQQDAAEQATEKEEAPSEWTVGIYTGPSPFELSPPEGITNPVMRGADATDLDVDIAAHPFMIVTGSRYYMFFTAKNSETEGGGIGLAESSDGLHWTYKQAVLKEPFVISHPYVFESEGEYYMIPEAYKGTAVRLYKATEFPVKWEYQGDILEGDHFISPTLVQYNGKWWMFVSPSGNETLRLFYADEVKGPWTEHPQSPIVPKDLNIARPGGRPFMVDGELYRIGQDCEPTYGNQVHAFKITEMTPESYAETMVEKPLVKASSEGWNAEAMHHVDAHKLSEGQWIAVVDALGK